MPSGVIDSRHIYVQQHRIGTAKAFWQQHRSRAEALKPVDEDLLQFFEGRADVNQ
jgi:hypothetical protein